ncbi:MAG: DUF1810 family protein [Methylococcales bacterium]
MKNANGSTDFADTFYLNRRVAAQETVYGRVLTELGRGGKETHWMWLIFPQIRDLGNSPTSIHFAISGAEEAQVCLWYSVLGSRLREYSTHNGTLRAG